MGELVLTTPGLAPFFQIELRSAGRMDAMRVVIEALPQAGDDNHRAAAMKTPAMRTKDPSDASVNLAVGTPGSVAHSQGKAVCVIGNRPRD